MELWDPRPLFDQDYLHFYLPHLSDERSDAEAEIIWRLGVLAPGSVVLDLACGHGRIANRLARRSAEVIGLDITPLFLDLARQDATEQEVTVDYVEGDMRAIPWTDRFDAVVCWFTAFGYFDDDQNRQVLAGVRRALRPGGRFIVEQNNRDRLMATYMPSSVVEVDGDLLVDRHSSDPLTGRTNVLRTIARRGTVRTTPYFVRLLTYTELRGWLFDAGFASVEGYGGDGEPLVADSRRMIVVATA
jgi:SAM-dependent methyltransferase